MMKTTKEKVIFFRNWVLLSVCVIPFSYILSLFAVLMIHGAFGFTMTEWGTPLSQTLMQIAGGIVIGFGTGLYQKSLLGKLFDVKSSWIIALIGGFVLIELVSGIVLWQMGLNRAELRFLEFKPLPESVIFLGIGLLSGLFQWSLLKKYFHRSGYWIVASGCGWSLFILINTLYLVPVIRSSLIVMILVFIAGALLYGALTGATLMWIMKVKDAQK